MGMNIITACRKRILPWKGFWAQRIVSYLETPSHVHVHVEGECVRCLRRLCAWY